MGLQLSQLKSEHMGELKRLGSLTTYLIYLRKNEPLSNGSYLLILGYLINVDQNQI